MKEFFKRLRRQANYRLIIVGSCIIVLFFVLAVKLFSLQVLMGDYLQSMVTGSTLKEITVNAPRGNIYDRFGRPLAVNTSSFTVNIDPSVDVDDEEMNEVLLKLIHLLNENDEQIIDEFPISVEQPYDFLYDGSEVKEKRWKLDMQLDENLTAQECMRELKERWKIDDSVSSEDARMIVSLRCEIFKKRFSRFIPIMVAYDIKKETIGAIEEQKSAYPCVYVDVEALRNYPENKFFSHILGYIRIITEAEFSEYEKYGYTKNDIVGKDGIEKAFELELNGTDGKSYVEVDKVGTRINTIDEASVEPIAGNDVFLTVDSKLQQTAYNAMENALKKAILSRLRGQSDGFNFTIKDVLMSMAEAGTVDTKTLMESTSAQSSQYTIRSYILDVDKTAQDDTKLARQIFADGIDRGAISFTDVVLALYEQGVISGDESFVTRVKSGSLSPSQVIISKIESGEITPQMTAMDPCTGSVVVTDVETGDVLAAVTYPSYDNNRLVNNFDNDYYKKLQDDPTTPLVNRPFTEPRAPGSTFKMITAIAGLQEGLITPYTTVYDGGTFKDAGRPYARCWIGSGNGSHGSINVSQALEVSCNYFFYDLSYRMGNSSNGGTLNGIGTLNKYMELFGLNDLTGVEIYELYRSTKNYPSNMSSPEYKRYIYSLRNDEPSESELKWYDGETIRTAIGQAYNNYTSAIMSKYVATVANGGTRYSMHFLDKVVQADGEIKTQYTPNVEQQIDIDEDNLEAVHKGMHLVTTGSRGTLRGVFKDYEVEVAAKSGTAQQSSYRSEHTTFVAFAPYDDPQISIAVLIPYGNDTTSPAANVGKEIISEYLKINAQDETKQTNTLSK